MPLVASPTSTGATLSLSSDTVTSASPYVFNVPYVPSLECVDCTQMDQSYWFQINGLRSVYWHWIAEDDNAFVYIIKTPHQLVYMMMLKSGNETISNNSRARYKPAYRNFHLKISIMDLFRQFLHLQLDIQIIL